MNVLAWRVSLPNRLFPLAVGRACPELAEWVRMGVTARARPLPFSTPTPCHPSVALSPERSPVTLSVAEGSKVLRQAQHDFAGKFRRQHDNRITLHANEHQRRTGKREGWSGRWDLNPRPSPWQGDALPLSHFRPQFKPKSTAVGCQGVPASAGNVGILVSNLQSKLPQPTLPLLPAPLYAARESGVQCTSPLPPTGRPPAHAWRRGPALRCEHDAALHGRQRHGG